MTSAHPLLLGDPYYQDPLSLWLRRAVEEYHEINIIVDETLDAPIAASQTNETIWVRPGMPLSKFHKRIGEAVRYVRFGEPAAPMFSHPKPRLIACNGLIIPR